MTKISAIIPSVSDLTPQDLVERLHTMRTPVHPRPFDVEIIAFVGRFVTSLFEDNEARAFPELQVLGYWLRPSAINSLKQNYTLPPACLAVPQGVVFHIPPANVGTMFAYSLFMSLLAGNANVIRLPSSQSAVMRILLRLIDHVYRNASAVFREQLLIVSYGHDSEITETISHYADLRMVWGGDDTVNTLRRIPLAPWGHEITFPDRFSWSALHAQAYEKLDEKARNELAVNYFNDIFWFDQAGCASPRVILWCGEPSQHLTDDFYARVAAVANAKHYRLDDGSNILKQTRNYAALIDFSIQASRTFGPLAIFSLNAVAEIQKLKLNPCFGGSLFEIWLPDLSAIVPHIERRDQTLTVFGFDEVQLKNLGHLLNGRGIDRIVPIGQALAFESVWDGYDLMHAFTRLVTLRA